MRARFSACGLFLILSGCASWLGVISDSQPLSPEGQVAAALFSPKADHHQHLVSPVLAALVNGEGPLPAIKIPEELTELLRARAERAVEPARLGEIYVENAVVFADKRGWLRGKEAAPYVSSLLRGAYRLTPVAYRLDGRYAEIAGHYTFGKEESPTPFGYFFLTAVKGADGRWRIASETPRFPMAVKEKEIDAERLIKMLDEAGIGRATVLSTAFWFDGPVLPVANPYPKVMAENDWTARQAALHPGRLVPFCSFNPIADHALKELERCAANSAFKGLKFSFAMSGVDLKKPDHAEKVRQVFAAANRHKLAIVAHTNNGAKYGREDAEIFINQILPAAPDIDVQVAHLWGGEGFSDAALAVYAAAVESRHPAIGRLYFDVAEVAREDSPVALTMARRMRQIGLERILYGSDAAMNGRLQPRQFWKAFRANMPLTDAEFRVIARNVAPYFKD
jgi:predicted TIM-barrel fold metal-dependent hydrolase